MISRARTHAIRGIIVGTLALASQVPDAGASPADASDRLVEALVAEVERSNLDVPARRSVLRRLALSADSDRRVRKSSRRLLQRAEASGPLSSLRPSPVALRESRKRLRRALRERSHESRTPLPTERFG